MTCSDHELTQDHVLASVDLEIYILLGQFANLTRLFGQTTDTPNKDHYPESESEAII